MCALFFYVLMRQSTFNYIVGTCSWLETESTLCETTTVVKLCKTSTHCRIQKGSGSPGDHKGSNQGTSAGRSLPHHLRSNKQRAGHLGACGLPELRPRSDAGRCCPQSALCTQHCLSRITQLKLWCEHPRGGNRAPLGTPAASAQSCFAASTKRQPRWLPLQCPWQLV